VTPCESRGLKVAEWKKIKILLQKALGIRIKGPLQQRRGPYGGYRGVRISKYLRNVR